MRIYTWTDVCDLPPNITKIGIGAFMDCDSLEYVIIPEKVKEIDADSDITLAELIENNKDKEFVLLEL